jgi:hypothetical protein
MFTSGFQEFTTGLGCRIRIKMPTHRATTPASIQPGFPFPVSPAQAQGGSGRKAVGAGHGVSILTEGQHKAPLQGACGIQALKPFGQYRQALVPALEQAEHGGIQSPPGLQDPWQVELSGGHRPGPGQPLAEQRQAGSRTIQPPAGMGQGQALGQCFSAGR